MFGRLTTRAIAETQRRIFRRNEAAQKIRPPRDDDLALLIEPDDWRGAKRQILQHLNLKFLRPPSEAELVDSA